MAETKAKVGNVTITSGAPVAAGALTVVSPTAVAEVRGTALPSFMAEELEQYAGAGNSKDASDSALPFLGLLQSNSPQVREEDPGYVTGAKAGFLLNNASKQVWAARAGKSEDGLIATPCFYTKKWVEWRPNRGGFVANYDFDIALLKTLGAKKTKIVVEGKEREQITLPNGNYLVETAYTFVLANGSPMVIGAASTALGPMREWMYARKALRVQGKEMPSFAYRWRLQSVLQTKGENSWYNWKVSEHGLVLDRSEYELGKALFQAASSGSLQIGRPDYFDEGGDSVGAEAAAASRRSENSDEDDGIPV